MEKKKLLSMEQQIEPDKGKKKLLSEYVHERVLKGL